MKRYGKKIARTYRFDAETIEKIETMLRFQVGAYRPYISRQALMEDIINDAYREQQRIIREQYPST